MKQTFFTNSLWEKEHRLLSLHRGEEKLEEVEAADGKTQKQNEDPLNRENRIRKLSERARTKATTVWQELRNVFNEKGKRKAVLAEEVRVEAEKRLEEEFTAADKRMGTWMLWGERRLALRRIEEQVLRDLQRHMESELAELHKRKEDYGKVGRFLLSSASPIPKKVLRSTEHTSGAIGELLKKKEKKNANAKTPRRYEKAQEKENFLRQELLELQIVEPDQLDALLERNMEGAPDLIDHIKSSPALSNRELKGVKRALVSAAKSIRSRFNRGYRLAHLAAEDPNIGTVADRLKFAQEKCRPSQRVTLSLAGDTIHTRNLRNEGGMLILRKEDDRNAYVVLDTKSGVATTRGEENAFRDYDLKSGSNSFSLAA